MPPLIKGKSLSIMIDSKTVGTWTTAKSKTTKLNTDLKKSLNFRKFAKNPKDFLAKYGYNIDEDASKSLAGVMEKYSDLDALMKDTEEMAKVSATFVAVAKGVFAVSDSKIALAW